jgi:hypothetical protein
MFVTAVPNWSTAEQKNGSGIHARLSMIEATNSIVSYNQGSTAFQKTLPKAQGKPCNELS